MIFHKKKSFYRNGLYGKKCGENGETAAPFFDCYKIDLLVEFDQNKLLSFSFGGVQIWYDYGQTRKVAKQKLSKREQKGVTYICSSMSVQG